MKIPRLNVKQIIRDRLQPKSHATVAKFPKTPTAGLVVHCQEDDRLYAGDGKRWVEVNTGPDLE